MRALAGAGRTADALAAYDRLAEELGLDPSARLRDVHVRLLRGELAAPAPSEADRDRVTPPSGTPTADTPPPLVRLPSVLTSFVPREAEVDTWLAPVVPDPGPPHAE